MEQLCMLEVVQATDTVFTNKPLVFDRLKPERVVAEAIQPQLPMDCPGFNDLYNWTDDELVALREFLLFDSIRNVCDRRVSESVRDEIWSWIDCDQSHAFSFRVCVATFDACIDVDQMRVNIQSMSSRLLKGESEIDLSLSLLFSQ